MTKPQRLHVHGPPHDASSGSRILRQRGQRVGASRSGRQRRVSRLKSHPNLSQRATTAAGTALKTNVMKNQVTGLRPVRLAQKIIRHADMRLRAAQTRVSWSHWFLVNASMDK